MVRVYCIIFAFIVILIEIMNLNMEFKLFLLNGKYDLELGVVGVLLLVSFFFCLYFAIRYLYIYVMLGNIDKIQWLEEKEDNGSLINVYEIFCSNFFRKKSMIV